MGSAATHGRMASHACHENRHDECPTKLINGPCECRCHEIPDRAQRELRVALSLDEDHPSAASWDALLLHARYVVTSRAELLAKRVVRPADDPDQEPAP